MSAFNTTTGAATFNSVVNAGVSTCCMTVRPLYRNQVLFINGFDYKQYWVGGADTTACTATLSAGPMAANDNVNDSTYNWAGAMVVPIHIDAFYLDTENSTFNRYVYTDLSEGPNDGKVQVLADRVFDFQVALGFDFLPADGVVVDETSANDEWLYNHVNDSLTAAPFVYQSDSIPGLPKNSLRMIAVGWVIGAPGGGSSSGATQASVLNGPVRSRPGFVLQAGVAKLGARSVYVFD